MTRTFLQTKSLADIYPIACTQPPWHVQSVQPAPSHENPKNGTVIARKLVGASYLEQHDISIAGEYRTQVQMYMLPQALHRKMKARMTPPTNMALGQWAVGQLVVICEITS